MHSVYCIVLALNLTWELETCAADASATIFCNLLYEYYVRKICIVPFSDKRHKDIVFDSYLINSFCCYRAEIVSLNQVLVISLKHVTPLHAASFHNIISALHVQYNRWCSALCAQTRSQRNWKGGVVFPKKRWTYVRVRASFTFK